MTAKPSQRGNDDSEVLKFKDFQGPLTSNSKTFKALFHFQGLSRSWKKNSRTFKNFQGRVATLQVVRGRPSERLQEGSGGYQSPEAQHIRRWNIATEYGILNLASCDSMKQAFAYALNTRVT